MVEASGAAVVAAQAKEQSQIHATPWLKVNTEIVKRKQSTSRQIANLSIVYRRQMTNHRTNAVLERRQHKQTSAESNLEPRGHQEHAFVNCQKQHGGEGPRLGRATTNK